MTDTFTPPKEEEIIVPEVRFSLQYTKFGQKLEEDTIRHFGKKVAGKPHIDVIGKNKDSCRKLFSLGYVLQSININGQKLDFGLGPYSNHIWIPQTNELNGEIMQVCMNCGSYYIDGKFIPYTAIEKKNGKA